KGENKMRETIEAYERALRLDPTRQQRVRLSLETAQLLAEAKQNNEALAVYRQFLKDYPEYSDAVSIYQRLAKLALDTGKTAEAEKYQREIERLERSAK